MTLPARQAEKIEPIVIKRSLPMEYKGLAFSFNYDPYLEVIQKSNELGRNGLKVTRVSFQDNQEDRTFWLEVEPF